MCVWVQAPFFFKPATAQDLVALLASIAAGAPRTPFYYYDIPPMTGVSIPLADVMSYASASKAIPTLRGAKYSDSDLYDFGNCLGLKDAQVPAGSSTRGCVHEKPVECLFWLVLGHG